MSATPAQRLPAPAACVIPATKFHVPRHRVSLLERDGLVAAVGGRSHRLLTLLSAPAGFGKTTMLTLWHLSPLEDRPFAWLSLDESDADPVRFWSCVVEALRTIVPDTGAAAEAALLARPWTSTTWSGCSSTTWPRGSSPRCWCSTTCTSPATSGCTGR